MYSGGKFFLCRWWKTVQSMVHDIGPLDNKTSCNCISHTVSVQKLKGLVWSNNHIWFVSNLLLYPSQCPSHKELGPSRCYSWETPFKRPSIQCANQSAALIQHSWASNLLPYFLLPHLFLSSLMSTLPCQNQIQQPPQNSSTDNSLSKWSHRSPSLQGRKGRNLVWAVSKEVLFTNPFFLCFISYRWLLTQWNPCSFENLHLFWHLTLEFISIESWCLFWHFQFTP